MSGIISIVTGAASGIGAATARRLADRGDTVICVDRDAEAVALAAEAIPRARAFAADITDQRAVSSLISEVSKHTGVPQVLVNCAGIEHNAPGDRLSLDSFVQMLNVNVTGSFIIAQAFAQELLTHEARFGRIVFIGSANSMVALPGQAGYAASKGAVLMLGKALAVDWAQYGITVNVVGPGVTDTPMSAASLSDPEKRSALLRNVPANRPAQPSEIAEAIVFLTSESAGYVTGAYLPVDGGWLARG